MAERKSRDKFEPLTDYERNLFQRLAANPGEWLKELMPAIVSQLEVNQPRFIATDLSGIRGEEWVAVAAFNELWVNFDTRVAAYYKDAAGRVHLEGVIKDGTIGTAAFTLPEGYRPRLGTKSFAVDSNGAFGSVNVSAAGVVTPVAGNNAYVFLDGISFRAA